MSDVTSTQKPSGSRMRKLRVCIYGGTDLGGVPRAFVASLAEEILMSLPAVIVTGGFLRRNDLPEAVSTDSAALEGARRAAKRKSADISSLFEAWVPDERLDRRPDVRGSVRMGGELGITVRVLIGRTALGRRLSMVGGVDILITVAGRRHTELLLEQAIELGVPALPIAHTGGDSKKIYDTYRERIQSAFAPGLVESCFEQLEKDGLDNPDSVRSIVDVIRSARVGRCLVLQPYRDNDDEVLYRKVIRPAVEEEMLAIRLKDNSGSQQIYTSFFDAVSYSTTIIADITSLNENVMYEVGYAHGRGLQPLLFTLDPTLIDRLPVYIRTLNVHTVSKADLGALIRKHLRGIKRGPEEPMPPARAASVIG
jgi:hypothetical protein